MSQTRLTTAQAAELLDLSARQTRHLAALGRIPGAKLRDTARGPVWVFTRPPEVLPPPRPAGRVSSMS
jgi:hypothetical protein